ncbi:phage protein [Streptococcus agalactiae]|nr:hypothetical protein SAGCMC97051_01940 [Streptococcus agalactiae]CNE39430.1 phage protein [Streptococcus agalactiae]
MVEIEINGELITFDSNFRDALIFTIDRLKNYDDPSLRQTYNEFKDYTDEDLMEYISTEFDVDPEMFVDTNLDSKWKIKQRIEEIYESSRYWQSRYSDLMSDYLKEAEENIELKKQLKRLKAENWQLKHRKRK